MDEPTSALDPISAMKIEDLAMKLKEKYTIVIVTHNMQQANRISDKTAFFLLGEIIEYDMTNNIFPESEKQDRRIYLRTIRLKQESHEKQMFSLLLLLRGNKAAIFTEHTFF